MSVSINDVPFEVRSQIRAEVAEEIAQAIEARSDEILARTPVDDPMGRAAGAAVAVGAGIAREHAGVGEPDPVRDMVNRMRHDAATEG